VRDRSAALRMSRRHVLKVGAGLAVVMATGASAGEVFAAAFAPAKSTDPIMKTATAMVTAVNGQTLTVRTMAGEALSARMLGFPDRLVPRVGDLVTMVTRPQGSHFAADPLCSPSGRPVAPSLVARTQAVPLYLWSNGVPTIGPDGRLSINGVLLVESSAVRAAAVHHQAIGIFSLDSTLADRQVADTQPIAG
jgi:hypothetical protein